jgi:hypothetical protein
MVIFPCFLYFLAGLVQEVLITSYHRCVYSQRNILASILTILITVLSLLVIAGIIHKIIDPAAGLLSYLYVLIFASGKGVGAYGSLTWWTKSGKCEKYGGR